MAFLKSVNTWMAGAVLGAALLVSPVQVGAVPLASMAPNFTPYTYVDAVNPANNVTTPLVGQQSDAGVGPVAETFNLAGPSFTTSVSWWGYYLAGEDPNTDNFTLNGISFGGSPLLTRTDVGDLDDGSGGVVNLYKYYLDLSGSNAAYFAGGPVTLVISNDSLDVEWYWQGSLADPNGPRAYLVEGDLVRQEVPEPSSLALFGLALLALGASRARKLR